jgi:hypothetical protein
LLKISTSSSAIVIWSPARVIRASLLSGVSIFGTKCSNLSQEYRERCVYYSCFSLISPEYTSVRHFAQYCAHPQCLNHLSKLTVARRANRLRHSHGHHENV